MTDLFRTGYGETGGRPGPLVRDQQYGRLADVLDVRAGA